MRILSIQSYIGNLIYQRWLREEVSALPHVKVREGEAFERAYRRFTKSCEKSGLMAEIRKHERYEKPSEARKRKSAIARRKVRKLLHQINR